MNIVEFLEARISEQEAGIQGRNFIESQANGTATSDNMAVPPPLTEALLAECAHQRGILADWKVAAEADGITDPADADGPVALARRSVLIILAANYKDHPDYNYAWALHS
ncbi:DUF6221 family protein [Arthrobacter sp. UYCu712]|uniref:DUF6221 family protein n=1 Tax=Arthrobacter sp. UYCu712 TaxID=3156340 RepID=UPI003391141B